MPDELDDTKPPAIFAATPTEPPPFLGVEEEAIEETIAITALDGIDAELDGGDDDDGEGIVLPVPEAGNGRATWAVRFSDELPYEWLTAWQTKATTKAAKGDRPARIDELALSLTVVAAQTREVIRNGKVLVDGAGTPVNFDHADLKGLLKAANQRDAVRRLYRKDGHVIATARRILDACGYGEELTELDDDDLGGGGRPTTRR